ncbi:uncharacterized protein CTHT_0044460 [Thermochaetoides thermophila DSM 1495]|uniref:Uncharacterized protein n=1 Tax=Chaetomium thermophilum (strain DSM 1495 / CBS 144.50 / IMI 039719) TaxID=759272 RepID=G0S942_CHATD|nr:hypothetical protein CTHT_0044460 [Thermochaetoides thermophila DSM 1495]EGS19953.1 hypothetical protein CTHT_0044460 [Thermochaetoides thermophila DSM 1495]
MKDLTLLRRSRSAPPSGTNLSNTHLTHLGMPPGTSSVDHRTCSREPSPEPLPDRKHWGKISKDLPLALWLKTNDNVLSSRNSVAAAAAIPRSFSLPALPGPEQMDLTSDGRSTGEPQVEGEYIFTPMDVVFPVLPHAPCPPSVPTPGANSFLGSGAGTPAPVAGPSSACFGTPPSIQKRPRKNSYSAPCPAPISGLFGSVPLGFSPAPWQHKPPALQDLPIPPGGLSNRASSDSGGMMEVEMELDRQGVARVIAEVGRRLGRIQLASRGGDGEGDIEMEGMEEGEEGDLIEE